jgi:hypothetical protein
MARAVSMISFLDRDDNDKVYKLKVTIHENFSVDYEFVGDVVPVLSPEEVEKQKPTLGDKVEGIIDGLTGGKLKKCGGCARRKAMLDKLGGSNEQVTETSRDAN